MKKLFIALGFYLISSFSFAEDSATDYYSIIKSGKDQTLNRAEAIFVFKFPPKARTIQFSYNGTKRKINPDTLGIFSLKVKPGKYKFQFFLTDKFYEVITDSIEIKPAYRTEIAINFYSSERPVIVKKPVIYVYPTQTMKVNITLTPKGKFNFTYPEYNNGWNFIADADGTIHLNEKKYNYLFWDGTFDIDLNKINRTEGFIVTKDSLVKFFEEKLSQMGLKSTEIDDYITYWVPLMRVNEKNFIHFLFNEEYNKYAALTVDPAPASLFRVFMIWSKATESDIEKITTQKIESFTRTGFTVVEWGGSEIENFQSPAMQVMKK